MNPRLGGALLALAAVALFVVSLATSAWWNGHPSVDGKVREIQEVHVGLHGGEGCNTRGCSALEISTPAKILGFGELGIVGFAAIIGAALGLASYRGSDRRQPVGKLALGVIGLALVVSIVLVALGPVSAQKVSLPIGWGLMMFWAGSAALVVASALAMRTRQPFQLKPSRPKLPSQPAAIPASAPYVPPLPKMQPATSFPPPAPMFPPPPAHPERSFPPRGPVFPAPPPPTVPPPFGAPMPAPFISPYAEPVAQNPLAPILPPMPPSPGGALAGPAGLIMPGAPPDLPPSEAMTVPVQKASSPSLPPPNRGAAPPPPPPRPSSPRPTIAGPAVAPERSATDADNAAEQFADDGTSPTIEPPPPLDATAPADDPTIPPPDPVEPGSISADATLQVDRVSAPQVPANAPPPPAPQTMPMPSVPMPGVPMPTRAGKPSVPPPNIPGFTGIPNIPLARPANPALAAAMAAPMGPPLPAVKPAEPALPPIAPPPAEPPKRASTPAVPISTASPDLPPPSEDEYAATGAAPACPQCESPMAWVDEHLRFYCKSCRMYF